MVHRRSAAYAAWSIKSVCKHAAGARTDRGGFGAAVVWRCSTAQQPRPDCGRAEKCRDLEGRVPEAACAVSGTSNGHGVGAVRESCRCSDDSVESSA